MEIEINQILLYKILMATKSYYKVYLSDEGFGPIIREKEIVHSILKKDAYMLPLLQTKRHYDDIDWIVGQKVKSKRKSNLIEYAKNKNGSPDLIKI